MAANGSVPPVKQIGVTVVVLISLVWAGGIFLDAMTVSSAKGRVAGEFNAAEAAMIGAGYTRVVYETLALIGFDVLCFGAAICNRLNRLHEAVQSTPPKA